MAADATMNKAFRILLAAMIRDRNAGSERS
jgi:hypothetical protein